MPLCHLFTNVAAATLREGIERRIANVIAETLKKPLDRVSVVVVPGAHVFKSGSSDPACVVNLSSIGVFDKEKNPTYSGPLKDVFAEELNIPKERIALVYHDLDHDMVGW